MLQWQALKALPGSHPAPVDERITTGTILVGLGVLQHPLTYRFISFRYSLQSPFGTRAVLTILLAPSL